MAGSAQLEQAKEMFRSLGERSQELGTIDGFRMAFEEMMSQFAMEDDIVCERLGVGGVPAEWITAPNAAEDRVL